MGYFIKEPEKSFISGHIEKIEFLTNEAVRRFRESHPECMTDELKLQLDFVHKVVSCVWNGAATLKQNYSFEELGVSG